MSNLKNMLTSIDVAYVTSVCARFVVRKLEREGNKYLFFSLTLQRFLRSRAETVVSSVRLA